MTAIRFDSVSHAYPDSGPSLTGIDLEVATGDLVLVSGRSGSGKSTLLRAVNGLVPHATGGRWAGTVTVEGRTTSEHPPRELADTVGFVHQDPEAQFVVDRVEGDVAFSLENLGLDQAEMRRRVEEALDALGVAHLRHRSAATLSGGEKQRVAIAGALAAARSVLVLDEPTSQLDPQGADDVLAAVARLNDDLGLTVVLAEHRLERVAALADRMTVLDGGCLVDQGPPRSVLAGFDGPPPVIELGRRFGWSPLPLTVKEARRHSGGHPPEGLPDEPAARDTPPLGAQLVHARGLRLGYHRTTVLDDVDLDVRRGEVVALLGRNGSGKTTLLRALGGLHRPAGGELALEGRSAYVPQDPNTLLFAPTVERELRETLRLLGRADDSAVDRWLRRLDLEALRERHPRSLSGGQRQRVAIAAVAVGGADVLLLDEPTRGIDGPTRRALTTAIDDHARDGGAVVLATHDVELAASCATRVVVLGDGEVVAAGDAHDVLAGSLFAPQVLRIAPPYVTVEQIDAALAGVGD